VVYVESLIFICLGIVWQRVLTLFSRGPMAERSGQTDLSGAMVSASPSIPKGIPAVIFVTHNRTGYHGCNDRGH
jgi:hypothetical protein